MVGTIHKTQKFLTERYSDCHLAEVDYSSSLSPSAGNQPLSRGVQRRIRRLMLITHILRLSLPRNAHEPLSMRELHTVQCSRWLCSSSRMSSDPLPRPYPYRMAPPLFSCPSASVTRRLPDTIGLSPWSFRESIAMRAVLQIAAIHVVHVSHRTRSDVRPRPCSRDGK